MINFYILDLLSAEARQKGGWIPAFTGMTKKYYMKPAVRVGSPNPAGAARPEGLAYYNS
jgi:hypothetical protein